MFNFKNNYISGLLSSVLSKYIEEIKPGELNISLFAGQNVLKNLTLKSDALTSMKLPFTVIKGTVGSISINCSVCSMLFYPFTLEISDVYILASVNSSVMYEQTEECISKMVVKQESSSIVNYITGKALNIAASVRYIVKNVHIRIDHAFPEGYVAAGFFIPSIEIFTIDNDNNQVNRNVDLQHIHKKIVFNDLSLYLDNYKENIPQINLDNFQEEMQNLITDEGHNFIFKNKSLEGKYVNNVQTQESNKFEINLEEILLNLSQTQYKSALLFMREFHKFNIRKYFAANGRPSSFPQEENENTSGYWWLYATHSAVLMNYRNNFKPDFALDFLKRKNECIQSIKSQNCSKDSINQATEKYGQNFMRSVYKYSKFFNLLPKTAKSTGTESSSSLKMSGNLGINKLQVKLYDEQMESLLTLNKNNFDLIFKSFESAKANITVNDIDFVTNETSYLKVGTPEKPAISTEVSTALNEINLNLSVQSPNVVFEEKLALYFKEFFDVRVETVKNLFKLEQKKSSKKKAEDATQRAINVNANLNDLMVTSRTTINDISFGVNLIDVKLLAGIINADLNGVFMLVNKFDILKNGNIGVKFNNNNLGVTVHDFPLAIDYIEIDDIVKHVKSVLNVVLGLTSKSDDETKEITYESANVPKEEDKQEVEQSGTPFTLSCVVESFSFEFLHDRQETFDLAVKAIDVSIGEDKAIIVKSGDVLINQMIIGRGRFLTMSGFLVKFQKSLNVDLNDVDLNLSPRPLNYILTALGLFNDEEIQQPSKQNLSITDQSSNSESLINTENEDDDDENDDDDDDDDDDESKKLDKLILEEKLSKIKVETLDELEDSKGFKFQSGTVMGIKKKEKKEEKKDSEPFVINININKGKIGLANRLYDFGTCGFEKATVPLSIGGPGLKFELFLDEVDFKSVQLEHFKNFLQTPKLHFGFYDKTIFLDSPSLEMDLQFQYLMTFINFASSLYHVYEDLEQIRKAKEAGADKANDTGLHLPDLKYKINLESIKFRTITRYIEKANHFFYILLTSFTMDSDVRSEMNFASKRIKLTTKENDTMISIKDMKLPIEYIFDDDLMVTKINVKPNFKSIKYDHNLSEELLILDFLASFISENTTIPKREFKRIRKGLRGRGRGRGGPGRGGLGRGGMKRSLKFKSVSKSSIDVPASEGPKKDTSFQLVIDVKSDVVQVISTSYKETNIFLEGFNYYQDQVKKAIKVHRFYVNIGRHQKVSDAKAITDDSKSSKSSKSSSKSSKSSSKSKEKIYLNILKFDNNDNEDDVAFELANNALLLNLKNITIDYEYKVIVQLLCIYQETRFIRYNFTDPHPITAEEIEEPKEESGGMVIKVGVSNVSVFFPVDEYKLGIKVDNVSFSNSKEGMSVIVGPITSFFQGQTAHLLTVQQLTYKSFSPEENKNVLQVITEPIDIVVDPAVIVSAILILENVTSSFKKLHISSDNTKLDTEVVKEVKTVYDLNLKDITIKVNRGSTKVKALQDSMTLVILRIPHNNIDLDKKKTFKFGSLEYINPNTSNPDLIIEPFSADIHLNLQNTFYLDLTTIRVNIAFSTVQKMIYLLEEVYEKVQKKSIKDSPPNLILANDTNKEFNVSIGTANNKHLIPRYDKISVPMDDLPDDFALYLHFENSSTVVFHKSELFYPNFVNTVEEYEAKNEKDRISVSWKRTSKGQKIRISPITVVENNTEFYIKFSTKSKNLTKQPKDLFEAQRFRTTEFATLINGKKDYVLSIGGMGYSKQSFKLEDIKENPVTVDCKWNDKEAVGIVVFAYRDPETFVLKIELNYAAVFINKLPYPIVLSIKGEEYSAETGEEIGCNTIDTNDEKCKVSISVNGFKFNEENEISLKNGETSEILAFTDESETKVSIAATIDRSYDKIPLRIILYAPIVFFNETGLDIGIGDMTGDKIRYFPDKDKMLIAGNKYFFKGNYEGKKDLREKHSFKIYYETDRIGAFEINPSTLNIDQNLLIPLNGNSNFVHYADSSMTYYAGNAFEAGNDMQGVQSTYLPLHYNVRSNQPDSSTLIVTLFCQVHVMNTLKFDIFLQPVVDDVAFGDKILLKAKAKTPIPITISSSTYKYEVSTSDPSQPPVLISLEKSCQTNFFLKRPISSKKSKQNILVTTTSDTELDENSKLEYVDLKTEIISTDFVVTFSRGTFIDSPYIIVNQLSNKISYTQKKEKGYISPEVHPNTSAILSFTYPFAEQSNKVYIDIYENTENSDDTAESDKKTKKEKIIASFVVDMETTHEQVIDDPQSTSEKKKKIYVSPVMMKGRKIINLDYAPHVPEVVPSSQYFLTVNSIEISMIDSLQKESILLTLGNIIAQYRLDSQSKMMTLDARVSSIRIDNLSEKAIWPVVLYSGKTESKPYFIQLKVEIPTDENKGSVVQDIDVSLQPLLIAVDTSIFEVLLEFEKLLEKESKKTGIIKPLQSSTSRHLTAQAETIISNFHLSNIEIYLNFSKNSKLRIKEYFINLIPNIKDFEAKINPKNYLNFDLPTPELTNRLTNDVKNDIMDIAVIMGAVTKIQANQASAKTKLKFVSGIDYPRTPLRLARAFPMKQILAYNENLALMQRQIRDKAKSDEVVEIECKTKDGRTLCLTNSYIAVFKKTANEGDLPELENMFLYTKIDTIQLEVDNLVRFMVTSTKEIQNFYLLDESTARMVKMFITSNRNALQVGNK